MTPHTAFSPGRRAFLKHLACGAAFFSVPGLFAEQLFPTPRQTEGPFYPDRLPLDTDNDLIIVNDSLTPAHGQITHLTGRILDSRGDPIRNALVEIWQADNKGVYLHTADDAQKRDSHFQGFGRFMTGSSGEYYFRTIKPVPYSRRTPHIHFAVKLKGRDKWTTQCYVKGEPLNQRDRIYQAVGNGREQQSVTIPFEPIAGSTAAELGARFDIVMGITPAA